MEKNKNGIPRERIDNVLRKHVKGLTNDEQKKWIGEGTTKPSERKMGPGTFPVEQKPKGFGKKK